TDNSDYKQRKIAKEMNSFIQGEFWQTKAYQICPEMFRDACVLGSGAVKILEDENKRVALERRLTTELLVDPNDSIYGFPRQLYEMKLVDRSVLMSQFPNYKSLIEKAEPGYVDTWGETDKTISDMILVVEGWHLRSGPNSNDGMHALACSSGLLFEESYNKKTFPFVFSHYASRLMGFWGQGLPERQFGTQMEINKLLITISRSINLIGVPRIFVEDGSAIVQSHFNNEVGGIIKYRGTPPSFQVAPCIAPEIYQQLQRLIQFAYEQEGISQLSATSQKPAGLNSGEAIRSYDNIQTDRFASIEKAYHQIYIDLAYQIIDKAKDIAERDGKYQTVFPDKDGVRQIDLPKFNLAEDPFVIQAYDSSSLPKEPGGRLEKIVEMMQASLIEPQEGRRLLGYPDIEQIDKLQNAPEERIYSILDKIVEDGEVTPPDSFLNIELAIKLTNQYYNLYINNGLEEKKADALRTFSRLLNEEKMKAEQFAQAQMQEQQMQAQGGGEQMPPQAMPMAPPQSE